MSQPTFMGHSNQRVTWVVIGVGLALLVLTMLFVDDETLTLYAGVAIGVGMVLVSGVVNYVAVNNADRGDPEN